MSEFVKTGHFYSAVPNISELKKDENRIWNSNTSVKGIDINESYQLELFNNLIQFYSEIPWCKKSRPGYRFYYDNEAFQEMDSIILYSLIRLCNPKNIIEIGSGFSSAVSIDTNEYFMNKKINIEFIEPYTDLLHSLIFPNDKLQYNIYKSRLQDIQLDLFNKLNDKDILFIDSTHVLKTGSDVELILGEILPMLNPGVIIHIHDIHWPFVLYKDWAMEGRAWNEVSAIRSFLQFNSEFEIIFMLHWMACEHLDKINEMMPLATQGIGNGLWIRRKGGSKLF